MTLLDACIDLEANIIPGKSTLIICNDDEKILFALLAYLNSSLPIYYIKQKYSSNSYNGGINFQKDMINNLPIPAFTSNVICILSNFGRKLYNLSKELYLVLENFLKLVEIQFNVDRNIFYSCLNQDFIYLEKLLKKEGIFLKGKFKDDWLLRFESFKENYNNIIDNVYNIQIDCDKYIFNLYNLTDEYIYIINKYSESNN